MITTKLELHHAIKTGNDNLVLDYLYKNVLPKIRNYITMNNGNKAEADDIFQDAVIIMYKKIKTGEALEVQNIDGLMFYICKNLWINRVSKLNKTIKLEHSEPIEDYTENALDNLLSTEKSNAFLQIFELLEDRCKQLLRLSIYHQQSMEEIAVKMQFTSTNAAKTHHYRCKQRLAELVAQDDILMSILKS
jgi:RNA polymerase sigma factor (sigma-70 family)